MNKSSLLRSFGPHLSPFGLLAAALKSRVPMSDCREWRSRGTADELVQCAGISQFYEWIAR